MIDRKEAEILAQEFARVHSCKHFRPYIRSCVLSQGTAQNEWCVEVYLQKQLPPRITLTPPEGMTLRIIPPS